MTLKEFHSLKIGQKVYFEGDQYAVFSTDNYKIEIDLDVYKSYKDVSICNNDRQFTQKVDVIFEGGKKRFKSKEDAANFLGVNKRAITYLSNHDSFMEIRIKAKFV